MCSTSNPHIIPANNCSMYAVTINNFVDLHTVSCNCIHDRNFCVIKYIYEMCGQISQAFIISHLSNLNFKLYCWLYLQSMWRMLQNINRLIN